MATGYLNRGDPNVSWWLEQVAAAKEFRKKYAKQDRWDAWRSYYRGNWKSGLLPVNMTFSHLRSMVPRVYFRNPAVSVTSARPGFLDMAFAEVVNRIDNRMIRQMGVKNEVKMMVQHAFMFGTAAGKLGFGARFTPSPPTVGRVEEPYGKKGDRVEYDPRVFPNMPWFSRVHPGRFLVPDGTEDFRHARWIGEEFQRPKDDVEHDERFDEKARHNIAASKAQGTSNITEAVDMVDLVEIRDAKTGKVFVIAPHGDDEASKRGRVLLVADDVMQATGMGFPHFPLLFNPDDEYFWGVSDVGILEPQQLERNEIRTQMMKHRRLLLIKLLAQRGKITEAEATKMVSEDVGPVVWTEGAAGASVDKIQISNIPTDLIVANREVEQDVRETLGFSRNQLGELQSRRGDTSATEARIVSEAAEIRIDERRDIVADMLVGIVEMMNKILFDRWEGEQVAEVVGPGGAQLWVRFDPRALRMGQYTVRVDPDSATPQTRRQREAKAAQVYEILKANPLIEPDSLTRYLLNEIEGVEAGDLMRALPPQQQGGPGPVGLGQFADMIRGGVRSAQRGAPRQIPAVLR